MSSIWRSGEVSADETDGGNGWISLGTTTRSLPKTNIAPALFAVPVHKITDRGTYLIIVQIFYKLTALKYVTSKQQHTAVIGG